MSSAEAPRHKLAGWVLALSLCAGLVLAWCIVAVAQGARLAQSDPEAALRWRASHGRAMAVLAEREAPSSLLNNQPEVAEGLARKALAAAPLEVRALRVLAWTAERRGDDRRAVDLMSRAAARSQRDASSHLWMFRRRLREGNYEAAYGHADTLMRIPAVRSQVASMVAASATSGPKATNALIGRLALGPVWRSLLIRHFAREQDPGAAFSILMALKDRGLPVAPDERAAVASGLLATEGPEQAYLAWVVLLSDDEQAALGNVYDGGFDQPLRPGPFSWMLGRGAAEISQVPGADGRGLAVAFTGDARKVVAQQLLVLPAGRYRLGMKAMIETASEDSRLRWTVACMSGGRQVLVELAMPGGLDSWRDVSAELEVPTAGCPAQRLVLTGEPGDYPVRGWFDDVLIEPVRAGQ